MIIAATTSMLSRERTSANSGHTLRSSPATPVAVLGTRGAVRGGGFRAASANSVAYAPLLRAAAALYEIAQRQKTAASCRLFMIELYIPHSIV